MASTRLAWRLREGFHEAVRNGGPAMAYARDCEPVLRELLLSELPARSRDHRAGEIWPAVIRTYRRQPQGTWAAVLLEMLAPLLVLAASRLRPLPPAILQEDIEQQLIGEALLAAKHMPLPAQGRWIPRLLVIEAKRQVSRWLAPEAASQAEQFREDSAARTFDDGPQQEWIETLTQLQQMFSPADVALLYRSEGLGETLASLAAQAETTTNALRLRRRRLMSRIQRYVS